MNYIKNIVLVVFVIIVPLFSLFGQSKSSLHEEDRDLYNQYFDQAGQEFNVPADILRGISFAETRWTHLRWAKDDTISSCSGMPRVYGVMGLWDNDYFGHTIQEAAALIGESVEELKDDPLQNIRGAAALLKKYYQEIPQPEFAKTGSIESWQNAVAKFSGFPQPEISQKRGLEVYTVLATGFNQFNIKINKRNIELAPIENAVLKAEQSVSQKYKLEKSEKVTNQPDYPLAKWNPAYSGNFSTSLIQQKFVVIHDVEGSYLGCISWFKNSAAGVSAHYVLNSHPNSPSNKQPTGGPDAPVGEITQMVEEKYRGFHVSCWNSYMIGIEHEGYASVSGWYTQGCYESSAKLVSYLCDKYSIVKDRNHVIAHQEWQNPTWVSWVNSTNQGFDPTCNSHVDPGQYWDWSKFMSLVTANDTVIPKIVATSIDTSGGNLPLHKAYKNIAVTFNTAMDIATTTSAFSISPTVAGSITWNADNTGFTFKPTSRFEFSTIYMLKIDTSAKNISFKRNIGNIPFTVNFTTEDIDTIGPKVVKTYPFENSVDVPTKPFIVFRMDDTVLSSSLSSALKLFDADNKSVSLTGAKNESINDSAVISFTPTLKPNQYYTLKLLSGTKDAYGNISKDSTIIHFKTELQSFVSSGTMIDQFETSVDNWRQPKLSLRTVNIDSAKTIFLQSMEKKYAGSGSGRLRYRFSASNNGVVALEPTNPVSLSGKSFVGFWVYGDTSNNNLKVEFSPNSQFIDAGKIHWLGWKFIQIDAAQLTGGDKQLAAILVTQINNSQSSGEIYIDDLQTDAATVNTKKTPHIVATEYSLNQNFPNPFNPQTTISFAIPTSGFVTLKVYDLVGREVATLVNTSLTQGKYSTSWDASANASGMYIYKLTSGTYTEVKRMMLLK